MYIPDSEYDIIVKNMPIICVDLLIIYKNKCLLLKRKNEPAFGEYWFPGGRINKLEIIKEAAIRKAKEETNLDCQFVEIISIEETIFTKNANMTFDKHTINICCKMTTSNIHDMSIDSYHDNFKWVNNQSESYHKAVNHPLSLLGFKMEV